MHIFTHLKKESEGVTGLGIYPDGMVEHDGHVGQLLKKIDDLGIANNTIVMYSTDNGAEVLSWPDGGSTPFRSEKDTNWEGGWRVPTFIRWPAVIKPGTVSNEIFSHTDMLPTLVAAAGEPDIVEKLKKGYKAGNKSFKAHIDGFNLIPHLKGEVKENPRKGFLYWSDDGDLMALRVGNWKVHFIEQRAHGMSCWQEPSSNCAFQNFLTCGAIRSSVPTSRPRCLRQVGRRPPFPFGACAGDRQAIHANHGRVPTKAKGGQFHRRRCDGET